MVKIKITCNDVVSQENSWFDWRTATEASEVTISGFPYFHSQTFKCFVFCAMTSKIISRLRYPDSSLVSCGFRIVYSVIVCLAFWGWLLRLATLLSYYEIVSRKRLSPLNSFHLLYETVFLPPPSLSSTNTNAKSKCGTVKNKRILSTLSSIKNSFHRFFRSGCIMYGYMEIYVLISVWVGFSKKLFCSKEHIHTCIWARVCA